MDFFHPTACDGVRSGLRCRLWVRVVRPCEDFGPSKAAGVARLLNLRRIVSLTECADVSFEAKLQRSR